MNWVLSFQGEIWLCIWNFDGSDGEWYLYLFIFEQLDLNWNYFDVWCEYEDVLWFWFDCGVVGVWIDLVVFFVKDFVFFDFFVGLVFMVDYLYIDCDELYDIYCEWCVVVDEYDGECVFVGEVWFEDVE